MSRAVQAPVGTFNMRYFVCGLEQWRPTPDGQPGPIFFYAGNVRASGPPPLASPISPAEPYRPRAGG